jgi:hypothetical protein
VNNDVDVRENELIQLYPGVLEILLRCQTTGNNILWATDNYRPLGLKYSPDKEILSELITGINGSVIMPRVKKDKNLQISRSKEMAEVFTPSWICNTQNNLIDDVWFDKKNTFNFEIVNENGLNDWIVNQDKVTFENGKTWRNYIRESRLEMACGEAPYITSRYDTTSGDFIPIERRIGILDRKLRVINENVTESSKWLEAVQLAYQNTYGFEWQGDSLLLAREAMLITFIENYQLQFNKTPQLKSVQFIAEIISWNFWQMDGVKGVIPNSCKTQTTVQTDLFGESETLCTECEGCKNGDPQKHNGIYAILKDWKSKEPQNKHEFKKMRFIDLIK